MFDHHFHRRFFVVVAAAWGFAACQPAERDPGRELSLDDPLTLALDELEEQSLVAPLVGEDEPDVIAGAYIVVFDKGVGPQDVVDLVGGPTSLAAPGIAIEHRYTSAVHGFSATLGPDTVDALRADPRVAFVEADRLVTSTAPPWGVDRLDEADLPVDGSFVADYDGTGVHAYVLDTGIRGTHQLLSAKMGEGYSAIGGSPTDDCDGHGTHVAGTIGGDSVGVAPGVTLHPVKVLGCGGTGSMSGVIAGVEWVRNHAEGPAVANMSLGGGPSWSLDQAVRNTIASGIVVIIAAGNENTDACWGSPNRVTEAVTVGATRWDDKRWSASNYGACVDIMAPGAAILSTFRYHDSSLATLSGTSMAAPHVTGVMAMLRQRDPEASVEALTQLLLDSAIEGRVTDLKGSPDLLLSSQLPPLSGGGGGEDPTGQPPPSDTCETCTTHDGHLDATGKIQWQPDGTYYQTDTAGLHHATLSGPSDADFDLFLYRWDGASWQRIAASESTSSAEAIDVEGAPGYYIWQVKSYSGSGAYALTLDRPS